LAAKVRRRSRPALLMASIAPLGICTVPRLRTEGHKRERSR
jgi:hypothetical protein